MLSVGLGEKIQDKVPNSAVYFHRAGSRCSRALGSVDASKYCQGQDAGLWLPTAMSEKTLDVHKSNLHRV